MNVTGFQIDYDSDNDTPPVGSISSNNINVSNGYVFYSPDIADISGLAFSGNKYQSTRNTGEWFRLNGVYITNDLWANSNRDNSSFVSVSYADPARDVTTYMGSIGSTATVDGFIAAVRSQDRYNWNTAYTAPVVNSWIKAGFISSTARKYLRLKADGKILRVDQ